MRQVARFDNESEAQRICDYLLVNGIATQVMPDEGEFVLWVIDEDEMDVVQREVSEFRGAPNSQRYEGHAREANAIRNKLHKEDVQAKKNYIDVRKRWTSGRFGGRISPRTVPITMGILIVAAVVFLVTLGGISTPFAQHWLLISRVTKVPGGYVDEGMRSIFSGEVWRLLSPVFLHGDLIHIAFNAVMIYQFGGSVELRKSWREYALLFALTGIAGNLAQYLISGNPFFGGLSGVVYGLLAYIWIKGRFDPQSGLALSDSVFFFFVGFMVIGFTGVLDRLLPGGGGIANWAHLGGFVAGLAFGYIPTLFKDT